MRGPATIRSDDCLLWTSWAHAFNMRIKRCALTNPSSCRGLPAYGRSIFGARHPRFWKSSFRIGIKRTAPRLLRAIGPSSPKGFQRPNILQPQDVGVYHKHGNRCKKSVEEELEDSVLQEEMTRRCSSLISFDKFLVVQAPCLLRGRPFRLDVKLLMMLSSHCRCGRYQVRPDCQLQLLPPLSGPCNPIKEDSPPRPLHPRCTLLLDAMLE